MSGRDARAGSLGRCAALLAIALLLGANAAAAAVRAFIERPDVAVGDTIEMTLEYDGHTDDRPDLGPLQRDFDILSTARSSNVQIINGAVSAGTALQLSLAPKHEGTLTVPSITWGGEHSAPLSVNVRAAADGGGARGGRDVFIETTVDTAQPYVQAAVLVTVRLYAAVPLRRASLELPAVTDVLIQQLGSDRNESVQRNGRRYQLIERRYALFPQRSGALSLPGVQLDAQVAAASNDAPFENRAFADVWSRFAFGGLWGQMKTLRLHGNPIALDVRPRPGGAFDGYWLPARAVSLTRDWHPDRHEVRVGDPLTLTLHLEAEGLTAAQLPDLAALLELPAGFRAYPDQPKLTNGAREDSVVGRREQSVALIADQPGTYTLPELRLRWWDTKANAARETVLPADVLSILPAIGSTQSPTASAAPPGPPARASSRIALDAPLRETLPWRWLCLALLALWAATALAWWATSRRRSRAGADPRSRSGASGGDAVPETRAAWRRIREACERNEPLAAMRALREWAAARWPESPPLGLRAIAARLEDRELLPRLLDLERACYAGGAWEGGALLEALGTARDRKTPRTERPPVLEPLYPDTDEAARGAPIR